MARDSYAFNPMFLGPELTLGSDQNIVESVLVSQFKPYLEATYGPNIPSSRTDKYVANAFFDAATAYSTDEILSEILFDENQDVLRKVREYIPHWLQLTEPLVNASRYSTSRPQVT